MENKKSFNFKLVVSAIFVMLILGLHIFAITQKQQLGILEFVCICVTLLLSILFLKMTAKKVLITLALMVSVVADCFLVLMPTDENKFVGLCVLCGVQFLLALYSLFLCKGIGLKIVSIALRVSLCVVAYFVIPRYVALDTAQLIAMMNAINLIVTLLTLLLCFKKEWLLFFGLLILLVCNVFAGLQNDWFNFLELTEEFADFLAKYDIALYAYIPAQILIALSSVWAKKEE